MDLDGLPNNQEIEESLIACILLNNEIINNIETKESDFYNLKTKTIFSSVKDLLKIYTTIDIVILVDYLTETKRLNFIGGISYITELFNTLPALGNYKIYDEKIIELSKRRQVIKTGREIEYLGKENKINVIYKQIEDLQNITKETKDTSSVDVYFNKYKAFIEKCKKRKSIGYPSIYPQIDKYTGGIIEGKVYTIVAYSNVGKSSLAYSYIPLLLKQGKKVLFFSLEVQQDILFSNIAKSYYNVSMHEFFRDFEINKEDFRNLYIYDNIYDLDFIVNITKTQKPDIIFIDYIQNIQNSGSSEYEQLTKTAINLQKLAIETNVTIFSISQANNESRFKNSNSIQAKGSGAIFASSDVMLGLSKNDGELKLSIIKNKYGPNNKTFLVNPDFKRCKFGISEEEEDKENFENEFSF